MEGKSKSENNRIAIVGGTLIDGSGNAPVKKSVILVNGNSIEAVGTKDNIEIPGDCTIMDVVGKTVMPGMIDCHVHLICGQSERLTWQWGAPPPLMEHSLPTIGLKVFARARKAFEMGFTTLRDTGDIGYVVVALRDAVNQGIVEGPRIVSCGPFLNTTGAHGDPMPPWLVRTDMMPNVADGVDGVVKAVRDSIQMNTDWIKFAATGGGLSNTWDNPVFNDDETKAMIDEAHNKGRRVAAHCVWAKGMLPAIKYGIDSVEHGIYLTEEAVALMVQHGTYLVTTFYASTGIADQGEKFGFSPALIEGAKNLVANHIKSFRMALDAGVKIAMGTDAGFGPPVHGTNAYELELLVEHGMTPMQAILATTNVAASCLNLSDKLGTVEKGKLADIIVIDGDPLADIRVLQNRGKIELVMKDGVVYVDKLTT